MPELNRDFYKDKASKMFGIPYDEVTDEQRSEAKKAMFDYMYCRTDNYPLKDCLITAKMIEQGNVTPLKDLHRRFISDCENNGYKITEFQDEVTIDFPGKVN